MHEVRLYQREEVENVSCEDVKENELSEMISLGEEMIKFANDNGGAGLSAPQIGFLKKVIVWKSKENLFSIGFNPRYYKDGKITNTAEGCLSYPNETYFMQRYKYIRAVYFVPNEEKTSLVQISRRMRGEEAIIFQHETDHINGITIAMKGKKIELEE
jgi:peptide deformylase